MTKIYRYKFAIFAFLSFILSSQLAFARGFISYGDYPVDSASRGEHGSVVASLSIDSTGNISSCIVVRSSTFQSLDDATCSQLIKRAKFKPALDATGAAISSIFTVTIHWILPEASPTVADLPIGPNDIRVVYVDSIRTKYPSERIGGPAAPLKRLTSPSYGLKYPAKARRFEYEGTSFAALTIDSAGVPRRCQTIRSSGFVELDNALCNHLNNIMKYAPEINTEGEAIASVDLIEMRWELR